jgi:hypothetical protein
MVKIYVRIGKGVNGYKTSASMKEQPGALTETRDGMQVPIPTVRVALNLDLSPTAFKAAEVAIPIDDEQLQAAMLAAGVV